MTLGEFKAFIEGMAIEESPTPEQWKRIYKKLEQVEESVTISPAPIVIPIPDACRPPYRPTWSGSTGDPMPELPNIWC